MSEAKRVAAVKQNLQAIVDAARAVEKPDDKYVVAAEDRLVDGWVQEQR